MVKNINITVKRPEIGIERKSGFFVTTLVRSYICGENIEAGQVVKLANGRIYIKRANEDTFFDILGVALQTGMTGDEINVLIKGIERVEIDAMPGLLFLNNEGRLVNEPAGRHIVVVGYKLDANKINVFELKDFYFIED